MYLLFFWGPQLLDVSKSDQYFGKIRDHTFSVMLMSGKAVQVPFEGSTMYCNNISLVLN